jgi:hypothetical protein
MRVFNIKFVLRMKTIEEQQFHDRYHTLLYSRNNFVILTKCTAPSNNISFYTQKCYISFQLKYFGV